jgi:hypothetical protein
MEDSLSKRSKLRKKRISHASAEARLYAQVETIAAEIKLLSNRQFVLGVQDEYLGYFEELMINIAISPDCPDESVGALYGDLLAYLDPFWEEQIPTFNWALCFSRGTEKVCLWPGDNFEGFWES